MLRAPECGCVCQKICVIWDIRKKEFAAEGMEQLSAQQTTDGKRRAGLDFSKKAKKEPRSFTIPKVKHFPFLTPEQTEELKSMSQR